MHSRREYTAPLLHCAVRETAEAYFHVIRKCGHRGGNACGQRTWGSAFHRRLQGSDARQHRRRLWRHRHFSPLYALREAVVAASSNSVDATPQAVLGVLSLILWALIVVVTLKYVLILLRADNHGEGGTLALMALAQRAVTKGASARLCCSASSPARCSTATPSLRRRCRCCRRSRASSSSPRPSIPMSCRSPSSSWWCCLPYSRAAPPASRHSSAP